MKIRLMITVGVDEGGRTCRDDDEHGGCYFNSTGYCRLFLRNDDVIELVDAAPDGLCSRRCHECLDAAQAAADNLTQERNDAERDFAEVMALTPDQVDAELRAAGYDPKQVGEQGQRLATTLLAERRRRQLRRVVQTGAGIDTVAEKIEHRERGGGS